VDGDYQADLACRTVDFRVVLFKNFSPEFRPNHQVILEAPIVTETDFGFIGVEESPKFITISFRGRTDFDTSQIAKELGGGGHKVASAVKFEGVSFDEVTKKVLAAARKYAKKD
jgi:nanoRNase/pAp phosphatase (c-di-AMP/oligoRNAs hydrolase)